jgi:anti-sigma regulatory factor (Ser/Thr protein kinase)
LPSPVDADAFVPSGSPNQPPASFRFHVTSRSDDPLRQARDNVVQFVQESGLPLSRHAIADLKLCTTEVVANALKHAGGECRLEGICRSDP